MSFHGALLLILLVSWREADYAAFGAARSGLVLLNALNHKFSDAFLPKGRKQCAQKRRQLLVYNCRDSRSAANSRLPPSFWRFNGLGAKKKAASHLTPKAGA
ncbi:MAG: hypothetical protein NTX50_04735, partial [Candidatus Sumerlaeota bacterium]|nr:hypothetical protein [Candidatus Sumerlaeota bacterium]